MLKIRVNNKKRFSLFNLRILHFFPLHSSEFNQSRKIKSDKFLQKVRSPPAQFTSLSFKMMLSVAAQKVRILTSNFVMKPWRKEKIPIKHESHPHESCM